MFSGQMVNIQRTSGDNIPTETITVTNGGIDTPVTQPLWEELSMVRACQKKFPIKSWAVPVVTGYNYTVFWGRGNPLDWTSMTVEIDQFQPGDSVILNFNFTDHREMFNVTRGKIPADIDTKAVDFVDPTKMPRVNELNRVSDVAGTYWFDNSTEIRTFSILLNGNNDPKVQYGPMKLTANRCWGDHCSTVSVQDDSDVEKTEYYWSDPSIWPGGILPVANSNVFILNTWHLILDIETPIFKYVEVNGILEFQKNKTVALRSNWIFVRSGQIISGSELEPILPAYTHEIILYGSALSEAFAFSDDVEAGNKVLAITGKVSLHGFPKKPWTLLSQNAYPEDNFIFVDSVDWSVGDEIAIAPSGFDKTESESFKIVEIIGADPQYVIPSDPTVRLLQDINFDTDSDWQKVDALRNKGKNIKVADSTVSETTLPSYSTGITKIVLDKPLAFYHSGAQLLVQDKVIDLRTEVAVLSRNVKIRSDGNGWGCNTVVSDFEDVLTASGIPAYRAGTVDLSNVEFKECGQTDTFKSAIRFEKNTLASKVSNSVIRDSYSFSVYANKAQNIEVSNVVVYKGAWKGMVITQSTSVSFVSNVIIRVINRGFQPDFLEVPTGI